MKDQPVDVANKYAEEYDAYQRLQRDLENLQHRIQSTKERRDKYHEELLTYANETNPIRVFQLRGNNTDCIVVRWHEQSNKPNTVKFVKVESKK